jgi:hypothetical protein
MSEKIRISYDEVHSSHVSEIIERDEAYTRAQDMKTESDPNIRESFIYKSWFYLMSAGLAGGFISWCIFEPFFNENIPYSTGTRVMNIVGFSITGGLIGLMIGCVEGILAKNFLRAIKGGLIGFAIGFLGTMISDQIANMVFRAMNIVRYEVTGGVGIQESLTSLFLLIIARSIAWGLAGMTVGLGPGIALKSSRLTFNGFLGGMIGGFIGGIVFDPVAIIATSGSFGATGGEISRALGFSCVGLMAGLMFGLVEAFTKSAWLLMTQGPLAGKQFIIYKNPTLIGSAPQSEIYIFKDPDVESRHATLRLVRDGYVLEDQNTVSGTFVNGERVGMRQLVNGDRIVVGSAHFTYIEKEKKQLPH